MKTNDLRQSDTFSFDDLAIINGIKGWVNFIGSEVVQLIDEYNKDYFIDIKKIKEVCILKHSISENNLSLFNWKQAQTNAN